MYSELTSSPIFNLSMASKELFHSNMLYWISKTYRQQFLVIMEYLKVNTDNWPFNWRCFREKGHFDLLIASEDEKEYFLVIENKVKSIPHTDQLDEYSKKVNSPNVKLLLLSLATGLPNQDKIRENGWDIKNYKDLAFAIYSILPSITNNYHRLLLEDYCNCILSLHEMQLSWNYKGDESYYTQFVEEQPKETSLRIEDMRKKVLYSKLAADLQKELNAKIYTNKQITDDKGKDGPGSVYVNYGMTRSMGLVDIKIRIKDNIMFVIQLQGVAYKHCVEALDKEGLDFVNKVSSILSGKRNNLENNDIIQYIIENFFFNSKERNIINIYPFNGESIKEPNLHKNKDGNNSAYNKYGQSFIYQYVKIIDKTTVNEVVDAINKDVDKIILYVKNN